MSKKIRQFYTLLANSNVNNDLIKVNIRNLDKWRNYQFIQTIILPPEKAADMMMISSKFVAYTGHFSFLRPIHYAFIVCVPAIAPSVPRFHPSVSRPIFRISFVIACCLDK